MKGRWCRLIGPGLLTLLMLAMLLALGTWQVRRLGWKDRILAQIAHAEAAPAVPMPSHPTPFQKVAVSGRFRNGQAVLYGAEVRDTAFGPTMGAQLIVPLQRVDGPPLLVDRGWVPVDHKAPVVQPTGEVRVSGFVSPAERPRWFSAQDDVAGRHFYTLDPTAIAAALGLGHVAPGVLVALGSDEPGIYPEPAQHLPRPPNNHFTYAVTWYALAAILAVIFTTWAYGVLTGREPAREP